MSKKEIGFYLIAAVLLAVAFHVGRDDGKLTIYPYGPASGSAFYVAHEGVEKNWSSVSAQIDKDGVLDFRYTLSKGMSEPFAALYVHKIAGSDLHYDFSRFDEIRIHLKSTKGKRIPVYLTIDHRHYRPKSGVFLSMPLVKVIEYAGEGEYRLRKSDFEIPSWWLRYHGLTREGLGAIDYSKVDYIMINSCQTLEPGDSDEIGIRRIMFAHDTSIRDAMYGGLLCLLAFFTGARFLVLKHRRAAVVARVAGEVKILVPYRANELEESRGAAKIKRIVAYIGEHYAEPDLTVLSVEKALGISAREIGGLLKKELGTSFKSYLNRIRLTEIKRLLIETNLTISEIAYRTGYNNISHFNRVFKAEFSMSPKEFRAAMNDQSDKSDS